MRLKSLILTSHPSYPERARLERADPGLAADRETEREHLAAIARIDQPVVPQPRGRVQRQRLAVDPPDDLLLHRLEFFPVDGLALAPELRSEEHTSELQ